jgi:hypothetical protein
VIEPRSKRVETYAPDREPEVLGMDDTINGGAVLPGFTLPVQDLFEVPPGNAS